MTMSAFRELEMFTAVRLGLWPLVLGLWPIRLLARCQLLACAYPFRNWKQEAWRDLNKDQVQRPKTKFIMKHTIN